MKLSTGKVAFPIEFDNGDKATIYFNPNDRGIQERIKNFEKSMQKRLESINLEKYKDELGENAIDFDFDNLEKLFEMSPEELEQVQSRLDVASKIDAEFVNAVRDELDSVFGSKISDVAFRYCEPFDMVIVEDENGNEKREVYIMHFIHWLAAELKKYGIANQNAMNKHISKYSK